MPPRSKPSCLCAPPAAAVRAFPAAYPHAARPLTARELQLASDLELARGNTRRGELLSWAAHDARMGMPA